MPRLPLLAAPTDAPALHADGRPGVVLAPRLDAAALDRARASLGAADGAPAAVTRRALAGDEGSPWPPGELPAALALAFGEVLAVEAAP